MFFLGWRILINRIRTSEIGRKWGVTGHFSEPDPLTFSGSGVLKGR